MWQKVYMYPVEESLLSGSKPSGAERRGSAFGIDSV
jgi:hypothetical protein